MRLSQCRQSPSTHSVLLHSNSQTATFSGTSATIFFRKNINLENMTVPPRIRRRHTPPSGLRLILDSGCPLSLDQVQGIGGKYTQAVASGSDRPCLDLGTGGIQGRWPVDDPPANPVCHGLRDAVSVLTRFRCCRNPGSCRCRYPDSPDRLCPYQKNHRGSPLTGFCPDRSRLPVIHSARSRPYPYLTAHCPGTAPG